MGKLAEGTDRLIFTDRDFNQFEARLTVWVRQIKNAIAEELRLQKGTKGVEYEKHIACAEDSELGLAGATALVADRIIADLADDPGDRKPEALNQVVETNEGPVFRTPGTYNWILEVLESNRLLEDAAARELGALLVPIGMLPSTHLGELSEDTFGCNPRYAALNDSMSRRFPDGWTLEGQGVRPVSGHGIIPIGLTASIQVHTPESDPHMLNAADATAWAGVAVGANSPWLPGLTPAALGRGWDDTRIYIMERVAGATLGRGYVASWEQALTECLDQKPILPLLSAKDEPWFEFDVHNNTYWRWNRIVRHRLRVEKRTLASGPSIDVTASLALMRGLELMYYPHMPELVQPNRYPFATAQANFHLAATRSLTARHLRFPMPHRGGLKPVEGSADRLLLPLLEPARAALLAAGEINPTLADRLFGVLECRIKTRRNGARMQLAMYEKLRERLEPSAAQRTLVLWYARHAATEEPMHTWPLDG